MFQELVDLRVENIMEEADLPIVGRKVPMSEAILRYEERSHVWVVEETGSKRIVGVVTEYDVLRVISPKKTSYGIGFPNIRVLCSSCPIEDIMTKELITIGPEETLKEALKKIINYRISILPVIDEKRNIIGELRQGHITSKISEVLTG